MITTLPRTIIGPEKLTIAYDLGLAMEMGDTLT